MQDLSPPPPEVTYKNLNKREMRMVIKSELMGRLTIETEKSLALKKAHSDSKDSATKKELAAQVEENETLVNALRGNLNALEGTEELENNDKDEKKEKVKHISEFKELLDTYFKDFEGGYVDLMTGMLLLAKYHKARPRRTNVIVADVNIQEVGFYYMRFAAAAYGIMLAALKMRKKAIEYVAGNTEYTKGIGNVQPLQGDKNVVFDHLPQLAEEDFIDGCWDVTKLGFLPGYFISLDRDNRKVVLALRGSANHHDWMTDLCGGTDPFQGGEAHRGMLHSAKQLYDRVGHTLLQQLQRNRGYGLVVCGHSLGAGVSGLFTLLWKEKHPDVDVRGFCFASPATVNTSLSLRCRDFVTTFVVRDDIVPRISIGSLEDLRATITLFLKDGGGNNMSRLMRAVGMMDQKKLKQRARKLEEENAQRNLADRLVPPGTIYHFQKREDGHVEMEQSSYQPFMEIIVSQTMFSDHMPYNYEKAFKAVLGLRVPKTAKHKEKEAEKKRLEDLRQEKKQLKKAKLPGDIIIPTLTEEEKKQREEELKRLKQEKKLLKKTKLPGDITLAEQYNLPTQTSKEILFDVPTVVPMGKKAPSCPSDQVMKQLSEAEGPPPQLPPRPDDSARRFPARGRGRPNAKS